MINARALGKLILVSALGYLVWVAWHSWPSVAATATQFEWTTLLAASVAAAGMFCIKAWYHVRMVQHLSSQARPGVEIASAYLSSQVIRYVPGKIWGLVYQVGRLSSSVKPEVVISANIMQMLTTNLCAALLLLALGLFMAGFGVAGTAAAITLIVASEWVHRSRRILGLLSALYRKLRPGTAPLAPVQQAQSAPWEWSGTATLLSEWVPYFLVFIVLLVGITDWQTALLFGLQYAAASMLAIFAIAVPGGIAVREALFVIAAGSTSIGVVEPLAFAVALRLVFVAGEIVSAVIAASLEKLVRRRGENVDSN